ncbi:hypothetical protein Xvie_02820 [Xenorhabdus vietnamensis]|uniref:Putative zinc-ribbon domain-containing protein n=1 Tax=Xenorhabdus vietnamensis TaxID=351656 RepID=A0A1Y2SCR3_9GAMM|nr:zinc ribbon domain-containing protein [Xenorhabdus vietnamensis]OTA15323.1 hypothetical protein Xvie_02820 [Xenorhabdus vietnamensis]
MQSESLFTACPSCGKSVSKSAKVCLNCGHKVKKNRLIKLIIVLVVIFLLFIFIGSSGKEMSSSPAKADSSPKTSSTPKAAALPEFQAQFIQVVSSFFDRYVQASNELQKSSLRVERKEQISKIFPGYSVTSWVGKIKELDTNSDGKAILSVQIASNITIQTWNNELSDIGNNTLIEKGTSVYKSLFPLKVGQKIEFSGSFFPSPEDSFKETSLTSDGSMKEPEFLFKFLSVKPID